MLDNFYQQVEEDVRECLWDIQDVIDGTSNDFVEEKRQSMKAIYEICKEFIVEFEKYQKLRSEE